MTGTSALAVTATVEAEPDVLANQILGTGVTCATLTGAAGTFTGGTSSGIGI